jgi:DNA-binding HxlR family transcriptional regulator
MPRPYGHFCALSRTLDVIGERWTPLVLRELQFGGRRFADLLDGLPGINATLLSARLKHLERHGVLDRRRLPAPAASAIYELTDDGRELAEALLPLARWGARRLKPRRRGQAFRSRWLLFYLHSVLRPEEARGIDETYELRLDADIFRVHVRDGAIESEQALAPAPADLIIEAPLETVLDVGTGQASVEDAVAAGELVISGDPAAADHFRRIFLGGLPAALGTGPGGARAHAGGGVGGDERASAASRRRRLVAIQLTPQT